MKINTQIFIRPLKAEDFKAIKQNISREVIKWLPTIPWPYKLKDSKDYIRKSIRGIKNKTEFNFGIIFLGKLIGTISLYQIDNCKKARVAYLLNKDYWGKGIMSKVLPKILEYGFKNLKLKEIYTGVIPENITSKKILIKNGFKRRRLNRKHFLIKGKYYDEIIMSLFREDYKNEN